MLTAADYQPPRWLRNPHVQSVLGSSPLRRRRGLRALASTQAVTREHILDGGNGVRLQGWHSVVPGVQPHALAVLLHGWEGSAESSYMRMSAAQLLSRGFAVFRLNFRDHGDTHHLNEELFHSNLLDEVVNAVADVSSRFPALPMGLAGYSLGGNFALRVGLRAPQARLPLRHVAAICPVLNPALTMDNLESGLALYDWYFTRKWRSSLLRKRELFPERHNFDEATLSLDMRALTDWMVKRHTTFQSLEEYFNGYSIAGDRLSQLAIPADILMAEDDPVIPFDTFRDWQLPAHARLDIAAWGGHCGFIENVACDGFAERWLGERMALAVPAGED
ncbi:YheT family hydrolase [Pseudoxanthomonas dokdonensis]|uniref:Alpha/beta hydrolase n=1 Tax=Pseudoxanthomonas dokdonensis TaxID=344882 RepID=A0A0R0CPY4_9GAMM|nr:alpha/beta fold hydrolase [Pseudoxanthomonas dokdonensis]KRG71997.1 alpha/beta hydrolase [Pseudoxanthomonas dokdonensis]